MNLLKSLIVIVALILTTVACDSSNPDLPDPPPTQRFSDANPMTIPSGAPGTSSGPAEPYPSTITVGGMASHVTNVTITVDNLTHDWPQDVQLLLSGPKGQRVLLMDECGDASGAANVTLTFDQSVNAQLPHGDPITSGTYAPSDCLPEADGSFPAPAPPGPFGRTLEAFDGTDPNGTWRLFVLDEHIGNTGLIADGWSIEITASPE